MTPNLLLAIACQVGMLATLAGLVATRRWRFLRTLPAFVVTMLLGNLLTAYAPARFYNADVWMVKAAIYDAVATVLILELGYRVFAPFRGALAAARIAGLLLLGPVAWPVMFAVRAQTSGSLYVLAIGELQARMTLVLLWLLAGILAVAAWYRVPIHPFHLAVLASFGAYLVLQGGGYRLALLLGWETRTYWNVVLGASYLALLARWTWIAWARESPMAVHYYSVLGRVGGEARVIFYAAMAVSALLVLALRGLSNQAAVCRDWDFALTAAGSRAHEKMATDQEGRARVRAAVLRSATEADGDQRRRFMDVGLRMVEAQASDLVTSMRMVAVMSRVAGAIAPARPLRVTSFRLLSIRGMAALAAVAHHVLVTTGERLRLRAYVLRRGAGIVTRVARRAVRHGRLDRLGLASADLTAVGVEALEAFHVLLLSLDAEPRGGPVYVLDDWR